MIGMPCKDAGCAVELFEQQRPGQKVRPSRLAKGNQKVGVLTLDLRMTIGSSDHKARFADTTIPPFLELCGQLFGGQIAPTLVQQNGTHGGQRIGYSPAAFRQLGELQVPCDPLPIPLHQIGFRRARNLSSGYDVEKD